MTASVKEFPIKDSGTPLGIARALVDYVRLHPECQLLIIVKDNTDASISMGWSDMAAGELALMVGFANYRWTMATFSEVD